MEQTITQVDSAAPIVSDDKGREPWYRRRAVSAWIIVVAVALAAAIWNFYLQPSPPQFEPASEKRMAFPLPEKPSIAVMPFVNMSGDPEQDYFSDGMTENLITALSKVEQIFVIARNSAFTCKGKSLKVQQVAEELGVRYILEGSIRKADDKLRITAQLVDATTGYHLWAEQYDREMKDIFSLQDENTREIVKKLQVELTAEERERVRRRYTEDPAAYDYYLCGMQYVHRATEEAEVRARRMFEKAVELDPEFALGYTGLAWTHLLDVWYGWSKSPAQSMQLASDLAKKALYMDDSLADAYTALSWVHLMQRQHEQAIAEMEEAVALDPNYALANAWQGVTLLLSGRPKEAIGPIKKAIRLDPMAPAWYFNTLGVAYYMTGRYEDAILELKIALQHDPDFITAHLRLAIAYAHTGREEEARAEAAEVRRLYPEFSAENWAKTLPYKNQEDIEHIEDGLRKAGLVE